MYMGRSTKVQIGLNSNPITDVKRILNGLKALHIYCVWPSGGGRDLLWVQISF